MSIKAIFFTFTAAIVAGTLLGTGAAMAVIKLSH